MIGEGGLGSDKSMEDAPKLLRRGVRDRDGRRPMRVFGRLFDAVVGFEDVPYRRTRGHLATRLENPTALDRHRDHQGLLLVLGPADEPVHVLTARHLAGSALAYRRQAGALEDRCCRPFRLGDAPQALYGVLEISIINVHLAGGIGVDLPDQLPVLFADLAPDVRRNQGAAVLDSGVGADELERRHEHVALADRQVDPVPHAPERLLRRTHLLVPGSLPSARGHTPRRLRGEVYAGEVGEAEPLVEVREPVLVVGGVPDPVRHLVEELVVGVLEGFGVVLGTVGSQILVVGAVLAPALPAADRHARRAPALSGVRDGRVGVDDAEDEARHAGEGLEGRGRRVETGYGAVGERGVGVLGVQVLEGPHLPGAGDTAHEELRVVAGTTGHGQDLTVSGVHRDNGTTLTGVPGALGALDGGVELGLRDALDVEIYGECEVLARYGVNDAVGELRIGIDLDGVSVVVDELTQRIDPAAFRHYPPEGIHVVDFLTGFAAQKLLVIELDPALTDYRVVGEAFEGILFELFLRDRTGVAEDVGGHISLRIVANVVVVHGDARELLGALADVGDVVAVGVLFDQHRAVLVPQLEGRVVALEYRFLVGPEDLGELPDLLPGYFVGDDRHVEAGNVVREDLAVAVVDDAALGGVLDLAGLSMPGRERVVISRENLQLPQPGREDNEDHRHHDRQGDHTHLHVALGHGRRIPALLGGPRLLPLAHGKPDHRLPFPLVAGPVTLSAWTIRRRE